MISVYNKIHCISCSENLSRNATFPEKRLNLRARYVIMKTIKGKKAPDGKNLKLDLAGTLREER